MERPELSIAISVEDFEDFYWLKKELVAFCRQAGISPTGGKIELTRRISAFLTTGSSPIPAQLKTAKPAAVFDWHKQVLSGATLISANYQNTENVRAFFTKEIGSHFSFNVSFMSWMKANVGKTLHDATQEWQRIRALKKDKSYQSEIAPQFEYNTYMRAFLADNPHLGTRDAMKFWKLKRALRGTNAYEQSDLTLT